MVAILQLDFAIHYQDLHAPNPECDGVSEHVFDELGLSADTLPEFVDIVKERFHEAGY